MKHTLDEIDFAILAALQKDGRLSNKELANHIGLAPSSCLSRVRRLRESQILRGFHADVDPAALGVNLQALIFLQLAQHDRESYDGVWSYAHGRPELVAAWRIAGADDIMLHVAVRDTAHLHELTLNLTSEVAIGKVETSLIFEHHRSPTLPVYSAR